MVKTTVFNWCRISEPSTVSSLLRKNRVLDREPTWRILIQPQVDGEKLWFLIEKPAQMVIVYQKNCGLMGFKSKIRSVPDHQPPEKLKSKIPLKRVLFQWCPLGANAAPFCAPEPSSRPAVDPTSDPITLMQLCQPPKILQVWFQTWEVTLPCDFIL